MREMGPRRILATSDLLHEKEGKQQLDCKRLDAGQP